jgi:PAS domain S-box-containing protein
VTELRRAEEALRDSVEEFQAAFDQATVPMSQSDCATATFVRANPAFCRLVGRPAAELVGTPIAAVTHPEDREADLAGYRRMARGEAPAHEMEKRFVRPDGTVRWGRITVSPVRDRAGRPVRTVAVVEDVTERREAEERQRLLLREVDHRARNALAVVLAALRLTPREDAAAYARAVEGRVKALARAHTLLAEGRWSGADLGALAEGELAPFRLPPGAPAGAAPRVEVAGPAVHLAPAAAQGVSMALHELATNATKHGALSAPGGAVRLSWEIDRGAAVLRLLWEERGGPPVASPPTRRGFGTRVVEGTVRDQLGGRVARRWEAAGLACATEVPLARLARA